MKNNLSSKLEKVFWVIYILFPLTTGILTYRHLPNESADENKHEILASYEECDPMYNQCGKVPIAWQDKITGQVYTKSDFIEHSKKEGLITFLKRIGYAVLGISFYFLFKHFRDKQKEKDQLKYQKEQALKYIQSLDTKEFPNISKQSLEDNLQMVDILYKKKPLSEYEYDVSLGDILKHIEILLEKKDKESNTSNQRNPFIALCDYASQNNWCWRINCTTCGHTAFRVGYSMLVKGYHPDEESLWPSKSKNDQDMMKESDIFNDFRIDTRSSIIQSQIKLAEIVSEIKLPDLIAVSKNQDDWMAYLGLVLHHCPTIKTKTILSESLTKQLVENTDNESIKDYLKNKDHRTDFLTEKDMSALATFKY